MRTGRNRTTAARDGMEAERNWRRDVAGGAFRLRVLRPNRFLKRARRRAQSDTNAGCSTTLGRLRALFKLDERDERQRQQRRRHGLHDARPDVRHEVRRAARHDVSLRAAPHGVQVAEARQRVDVAARQEGLRRRAARRRASLRAERAANACARGCQRSLAHG